MKKNLFRLLIFSIILIILSVHSESVDNDLLIVTGKYEVKKQKNFVNLKDFQIPVQGKDLYLQVEVAKALQKMFLDLKKEHPNIEFWVTSGVRTYWDQKRIWESKWKNMGKISSLEKTKKILEYSSMPATSRHHWGTDFDINILENSYYEKGNGKLLWDWLNKNAKKYGFCMPYNENRPNGYHLEKWHWSYKPIATRYQKKWNEYFYQKKITELDFSGNEYFYEFAPLYVNSINPDCL